MDAANEIKALKHIWILFSYGNADHINEINPSVYNPFGTRAKHTNQSVRCLLCYKPLKDIAN